MTNQSQRVKHDADVYAADHLGAGCGTSTTNPTAYAACVTQENQVANDAAIDKAAANAQLSHDRDHALTLGRVSVGYINSFVYQLDSLRWPGNLKADAAALVSSLIQYRTYFDKELTAYSKSDFSTVNADASHATIAYTAMQNAIVAINATLGVPTSTSGS